MFFSATPEKSSHYSSDVHGAEADRGTVRTYVVKKRINLFSVIFLDCVTCRSARHTITAGAPSTKSYVIAEWKTQWSIFAVNTTCVRKKKNRRTPFRKNMSKPEENI